MPILHRYPRAACTNVPDALPDLNTAFPPGQFVLGEFLFVRNMNTLWVRTIDAGNAPIWFALSGGGAAAAASGLAPIHFAGGANSNSDDVTAGFLANNPLVPGIAATALQYVKTVPGMVSVRLRTLRTFVSINTVPAGGGAHVWLTVYRNGVSLEPSGLRQTYNPLETGAKTITLGSPLAVSDGDTFDLELNVYGGDGSQSVVAAAEIGFVP